MKLIGMTVAGVVGVLATAMTAFAVTGTQPACETAMQQAHASFHSCLARCDQHAELSTNFDARRCHVRCGLRFGRSASRVLSTCPPAQTVNMGVNDFNDTCNPSDVSCIGDLEDAGCVTVDGVGGAFDCGSAIPPGHGGAGVPGGPAPGPSDPKLAPCPHGTVYDRSVQCDCPSPPYWELMTSTGFWCGACELGCPHTSPAGEVSCCPSCSFASDGTCLDDSVPAPCANCVNQPPPSQ